LTKLKIEKINTRFQLIVELTSAHEAWGMLAIPRSWRGSLAKRESRGREHGEGSRQSAIYDKASVAKSSRQSAIMD
jgi:hypothetical protein